MKFWKILLLYILLLTIKDINALECPASGFVCTKVDICQLPGKISLQKEGEIVSFPMTNFTELVKIEQNELINKKPYINGKYENNLFTLYVLDEIKKYSMIETTTSFTIDASFKCVPNIDSIYKFIIYVDDTNLYPPEFSKPVYEFKISLPIIPGYDCFFAQQIEAIDMDLVYHKIKFSLANNSYFDVESSQDGHKSFANLKLKKAIIEIDEKLEIDIEAEDNGKPPKKTTAKIILTADKKKSLPTQPRFENSFYEGKLNPPNELIIEPAVVESTTYDERIRFNKIGKDSELFEIVNNNSNIINIKLKEDKIDDEIIKNKTFLAFIIQAFNPELPYPTETAIVIDIPKFKSEINFDKPIYEGVIGQEIQMNTIEIKFSTPENINNIDLKLIGEDIEKFSIEKNETNAFIKLNDDVTELPSKWSKRKYLSFEIHANNSDDKNVISGVLINLPTKLEIPAFDEILYKGKIISKIEINVPLISVENLGVPQFKLSGHNNFTIDQRGGIITVSLKENQELTNEDLLSDYIQLTLEAIFDDYEGRKSSTSIILATPKSNIHPEFTQSHYKGRINDDLELDIEKISIANNIQIKRIYLDEGDFNYFTAKEIENNRLIEIELKPDLTHEDIEGRKYFEFLVFVETLEDFSNSVLVTIDLPFRCDDSKCPPCTTPIPPTTPTPPDEPKFEKDLYRFSIRSDDLGIIGQCKATLSDDQSGSQIEYSFGQIDEKLKSRLNLYRDGSLEMTASIQPGIFHFELLASLVDYDKFGKTNVVLDISPIQSCDDEISRVENALLIQKLEEERPHYGIISLSMGNCHYEILQVSPNDKEYFVLNTTTNQLDLILVDREADIFSDMLVVQIQLKLILEKNANYLEDTTSQEPITEMIIPSTESTNEIEFENSSTTWKIDFDYEESTMETDIENDESTTQIDFDMSRAYATRTINRRARNINLENNKYYVLTESIKTSLTETVLTVIVEDINDNKPKFTFPMPDTQYVIGYPDTELTNEILPEFLLQVHAIDFDIGWNAMIRYELESSDFGIDGKTGIIYPYSNAMKSFDEVELTVYAKDRNGEEGSLSSFVNILVKKIRPHQLVMFEFQGTEIQNADELLKQISDDKDFVLMPLKWAIVPEIEESKKSLIQQIGKSIYKRFRSSQMTTLRVWSYAFDEENNFVESKTIIGELSENNSVIVGPYETDKDDQQSLVGADKNVVGFIVGIVILSIICLCAIAGILWLIYFRKILNENVSSLNPSEIPSYSANIEKNNLEINYELTPQQSYSKRESMKILGSTIQETSDYENRMMELLKDKEEQNRKSLSFTSDNASENSYDSIENKMPNGDIGDRRKSVVTFNELVERIEISDRRGSQSSAISSERL